jgi:hypothetical protein
MKPRLQHLGDSRSALVVIDEFTGAVDKVVEAAAALAPYPKVSGSYYPGLRRVIGPSDGAAFSYVQHVLEAIAPFVGGAFGVQGYGCREASFSMVTASPASLGPQQRMPHFDSTDPKVIAVLHYLSDTPGTGTAFFRQRSTGIETVEDRNLRSFMAAAQQDSARLEGYIASDNLFYERIGFVEAVPDRLIIYQGRLLHSGVIPPGMDFSDDPRKGRLTGNLFLQAG